MCAHAALSERRRSLDRMIDQSAREVGVILGEGRVGERHKGRASRRRAHLARGAAYGRRKRAKSRHVVRNPARAFPVRLTAPSLRLGAMAAYRLVLWYLPRRSSGHTAFVRGLGRPRDSKPLSFGNPLV